MYVQCQALSTEFQLLFVFFSFFILFFFFCRLVATLSFLLFSSQSFMSGSFPSLRVFEEQSPSLCIYKSGFGEKQIYIGTPLTVFFIFSSYSKSKDYISVFTIQGSWQLHHSRGASQDQLSWRGCSVHTTWICLLANLQVVFI